MAERSVRLTEAEFLKASKGGYDRTVHAYLHGWKRKGCPVNTRWDDSICGACGELAVCRVFGFTWDATVGRTDAPDAGPYQVRTTHTPDGHLILRDNEPEKDDVFILVTGHGRDYVIRGWLVGRAGKRKEWLRNQKREGVKDPQPAYWVPQSALLSLDTLPPPDPSYAQEVGNIPTFPTSDIAERVAAAAGAPLNVDYCPVCWQPDRLDAKGRILPPEHDAHRHAVARG